jgi:hypothetical protein
MLSADRSLWDGIDWVGVRNEQQPLSAELFFSGEGPRSRRYGRTAALRLLVQPCDEDDDDDCLSIS